MPNGWGGADPTVVADSDDYELGTEYRANADVTLTHVRVWADPTEEGQANRKGRIWTTGGVQLALADMPTTLAAGWSTHALSSTVSIASGARFVVSYSTGGKYGAISGALASDVLSPDGRLTALASSGATNGNGIFHVDRGSFPTTSLNQTFYGADVVYRDPGSLSTIYANLTELKSMRRIADTVDDTALQNALSRASRAIDKRTGRRFYFDGSVSARQYRTRGRVVRDRDGDLLLVDDISTTTGLVVEVGDGTTWTAVTDYFTEPDNALARGVAIEALRRDLNFWTSQRRVRVTADWGWPSIPDPIVEATLLLANRRFMRRDSPEGVAGWADQGPVRVSRFDPDIEELIAPFVLPGVG